jgi:predicted O-linked N-acetylglucosamine transferase (SPINDLY family)
VTFGSFNYPGKITPAVIAAWAGILQAVPGARLVLKNAGLGEPETQRLLQQAFADRGVAPERLTLLGQDRSLSDHLARYHDIDIGLDPFPYNGTTTTCEALWMGVPVVTLAGATHAGRVGVSLLTQLGLPEFIAGSVEEYIALAARWAGDLDRLGALRRGLRERMAASPLTDAGGFTAQLERAYLGMLAPAGAS